jgi:hypothetical protein
MKTQGVTTYLELRGPAVSVHRDAPKGRETGTRREIVFPQTRALSRQRLAALGLTVEHGRRLIRRANGGWSVPESTQTAGNRTGRWPGNGMHRGRNPDTSQASQQSTGPTGRGIRRRRMAATPGREKDVPWPAELCLGKGRNTYGNGVGGRGLTSDARSSVRRSLDPVSGCP